MALYTTFSTVESIAESSTELGEAELGRFTTKSWVPWAIYMHPVIFTDTRAAGVDGDRVHGRGYGSHGLYGIFAAL